MESNLRNTFNIRNWSVFELIWIGLFMSAGTLVTIFTKDSFLNYVILLTGILCVVLAAKGNIWTYGFGLVNSVGYAWVSFTNGLYGDMGLNILFFAPTSIIGLFMWKHHLGAVSVEMRGLNMVQLLLVLLACAVLIFGLGFSLSFIRTQNTPYLDATSTVLSVVATFLMMWRYKEQWLLYITLNAVTIVMWEIRLLNGSSDGKIMVIMWTALLVNSIYGYFVWRKGASKAKEEASVS
jgi:nicotinamide mononucleotide transporter